MATIAEQLTSLAETKTAIKDAIVEKGVEVSDTDTFRSYADKIGQIQAGGGEPATKFGASVDTWVGDVDENGVLNQTTWTGALNFAGVKEIGDYGLQYAFNQRTGITSVDLSSLQSVDERGMYYMFESCTGIISVDLSSLQSVGASGLAYAFYGCTGITTMSFPSLTSVQSNSFNYAFRNCTALTEIHFRADIQATIEAMSQYANKFGATNATIYFDL